MKLLYKKHCITILVLNGFVPFDVAIPYNIFSQVKLKDGENPYDVSICGHELLCSSQEWKIKGNKTLTDLALADTIIIPGIENALTYNNQQVFDALRNAAENGVRIASICTGSCILAATGILNGLKATTHWNIATELSSMYPQVKIESDVLFIDNGQFLTSAGLASGIDLCLHMIRKDYGATVAENSAQFFVTPIERDGSYRQLTLRKQPQKDDPLILLLYWLMDNLQIKHTLKSIADHANMSTRTLNRKFKNQFSVSPMIWLMTIRIKRAQNLLETTTLSVEQVATNLGFSSAAIFRIQFRKTVGVSPTVWRKAYTMYSH